MVIEKRGYSGKIMRCQYGRGKYSHRIGIFLCGSTAVRLVPAIFALVLVRNSVHVHMHCCTASLVAYSATRSRTIHVWVRL